jgi:hypothetical protein
VNDAAKVLDLAERIRGLSPAELLALVGMLAGELAAERARRPDAAGPVDRDELKRRCNLLASRAETGGAYGRVICGFCGKQKSTVSMAKHLQTSHGEEIAGMPARLFPKFNA